MLLGSSGQRFFLFCSAFDFMSETELDEITFELLLAAWVLTDECDGLLVACLTSNKIEINSFLWDIINSLVAINTEQVGGSDLIF